MTYCIRKAQFGDEMAIHQAHMESIREVCVKDHGPDEVQGWGNREFDDRWEKCIKQGFTWVLESNHQIDGVASFRRREIECEAHIHALYLKEIALGQGWGLKMLNVIVDEVKRMEFKKITLLSSITAYKFYKQFGFKDNGQIMQVEIGGSKVTCYPMIINLK